MFFFVLHVYMLPFQIWNVLWFVELLWCVRMCHLETLFCDIENEMKVKIFIAYMHLGLPSSLKIGALNFGQKYSNIFWRPNIHLQNLVFLVKILKDALISINWLLGNQYFFCPHSFKFLKHAWSLPLNTEITNFNQLVILFPMYIKIKLLAWNTTSLGYIPSFSLHGLTNLVTFAYVRQLI